MLNITNHKVNAKQNHNEISLYSYYYRTPIIRKTRDKRCWKRCSDKGTLMQCWWFFEVIQPLERTVWRFLKTLKIHHHQFGSVQSLSRVPLFGTPWTAARQASLSITNTGACSDSCPSSQWCHPTISSSVFPFSSCLHFPSIRVFSSESALCIRWPKYWSFSFSISPSKVYSGLISFRMD